MHRAGARRDPYCEKQGWDWSAALHVDHGQHAGKVALPGSSKEQPGREEKQVSLGWFMDKLRKLPPQPGPLIHSHLLLTQGHPPPSQVPPFSCTPSGS